MKVLLVGPEIEENLSIRYLSSALIEAGHSTRIAPFNSPEDLEAVVKTAAWADMAALSICFQVRAGEFLSLARALKGAYPRLPVIAGGHYASCAAGDLLSRHPELDLVAIHEGERTIVEIADAGFGRPGSFSRIKGVVYRDGGAVATTPTRHTVEDLDSLPFPDRRGPVRLLAGVPTSYIMGSRGCFGSCSYCCITTLHKLAPGKRFRQRDPEKVADEMAELYHRCGTRQFSFHDDNFLVPSVERNLGRLHALDAALRERGVEEIGLVIKCRPAEVDERVFSRLRGMGLLRVFLGIESGSPDGLSGLGRDQRVEQEERALEICRRLGISAQYTIMTFHPSATAETVRADIAFMRRNIDHPLNFCRAEIYAGTPLEAEMIRAGRARGDYLARTYSMADPVMELACRTVVRHFMKRCWTNVSMMNLSIRTDHLAAILARFYGGTEAEELCAAVRSWRLEVNSNSLALLERVVDRAEASGGKVDQGFRRFLERLSVEEEESRIALMARGFELRDAIDALALGMVGCERVKDRIVRRNKIIRGVARHAAAVLIALGIAGSTVSMVGCADLDNSSDSADVHNWDGSTEDAGKPVDSGMPDGGHKDATYGGDSEDAGAPLKDGGHDGWDGSTEDAGAPLDAGPDDGTPPDGEGDV